MQFPYDLLRNEPTAKGYNEDRCKNIKTRIFSQHQQLIRYHLIFIYK